MPDQDLHDRYFRKAQALSKAYEISQKDRVKEKVEKGEIKPVDVACYKCKKVKPCKRYPIFETGRHEGAVSVSNEMVPMCEDCAPKRKKNPDELTPNQVKSLLRGAKKGRV